MIKLALLYFMLKLNIDVLEAKDNIIFILADDIGWADVPWNNDKIRTKMPTLQSLYERSVSLTQMYTLPVCTPSRAALLTGIYPFRYGFQRGFGNTEPTGLPTDINLLPQYLKTGNYSTHMLGKWHLGHCNIRYTPINRGFDSFFGCYAGAVDHWTRIAGANDWTGYDLRDGNEVSNEGKGLYSTDLWAERAHRIISTSTEPYFLYIATTVVHSPFQNPEIRNSPQEPLTAGLRNKILTSLDTLVAKVLDSVKRSGSAERTLVVFTSDNGARNQDGLFPNLPLRGGKMELYEGGTRVPALLYHPSLQAGTYDGMMHMVDWLPTLLSRAGLDPIEGLDGLDQSQAIWRGVEPPRKEMVYNIDEGGIPGNMGHETIRYHVGLREGEFKLIWGNPGMLKKEDSERDTHQNVLQLFNLKEDPNEETNLARSKEHQDVLEKLQNKAKELAFEMVPVNDNPPNHSGTPDKNEGLVTYGWCTPVSRNFCSTKSAIRMFERKKSQKYITVKAVTYRSELAKEYGSKVCMVQTDVDVHHQ